MNPHLVQFTLLLIAFLLGQNYAQDTPLTLLGTSVINSTHQTNPKTEYSQMVKSFYSKRTPVTWDQAVDYCQAYGMELASITNPEDQAVLDELTMRKAEALEWWDFWLSGRNFGGPNRDLWEWMDSRDGLINLRGQPGFQNWAEGYPFPEEYEWKSDQCLYIYLGNYNAQWESRDCGVEYSWAHPLCMVKYYLNPDDNSTLPDEAPIPRTTVAPIPTSTFSPMPAVPLENLTLIGTSEINHTDHIHTKVFYSYNMLMSMRKGVNFCYNNQLQPAIINSLEEQTVLTEWAGEMGQEWTSFWLSGMKDQGVWIWIDSDFGWNMSLGFQNWVEGQPTEIDGDEKECLYADLEGSGGKWTPGDCGEGHYPLCTMEI